MSEDLGNKVNIDVYFAEFETPEVVITQVEPPAAAELPRQPESSVPPSVLPTMSFDKPPHCKDLTQHDLNEAAFELQQLRWQIDDTRLPPTPYPQKLRHARKVLQPVVAGMLVTLVAYGALITVRNCRDSAICQPVGQISARLMPAQSAQPDALQRIMHLPQHVVDQFHRFEVMKTVRPTAVLAGQPELDFQSAIQAAEQAQTLQETAIQPDEWQQVVQYWEAAIAHMTNVPPESDLSAAAQEEMALYQKNLDYARSEIDPFREAVNFAMQAAIMTQSASTDSDWQAVGETWIEAIRLMDLVADDSPHYSLAQHKIVEYSSNLLYAQSEVLFATRTVSNP